MNAALVSLTEAYTDSENEDNNDEVEKSDPEEKQIKAQIVIQPKNSKHPRRLVSYNDNEIHGEDISDDDEPNPEDEKLPQSEDMYQKLVSKYGDILPKEPKGKVSPKLQETVTNLNQKIKVTDFDLNQYIQSEKKFRNPSIYDKLITFMGINEFGSNFDKGQFDPTGFRPESFYEELAKSQKIEMDKFEKQKKENVKTEVIIKDSAKSRKSKWDQQPQTAATTNPPATTKTTVISAFGTLKKPKV